MSDEDNTVIPPQTPIRWAGCSLAPDFHCLTCSFVNVKPILCFLASLFSFCHIHSARILFLKAINTSLKKWIIGLIKANFFIVSPELPWLPFSSWGEISPPVGTNLLLTWLHISKLVLSLWQKKKKKGTGYCGWQPYCPVNRIALWTQLRM